MNRLFCALIIIMFVTSMTAMTGCEEKPTVDDVIEQQETGNGSAEEVAVEPEVESEPEQENEPEEETEPEEPDDEIAQYELEYTLADIEEILGRGMYFIVGNQASAMDIITISEIKSGLTDLGIETGDAKLADEVADYTTEDYIVIGSPCDNPVAAKLFAKEIEKKGSCEIINPGTAWIKLFKTSEDNIALFLGGRSPTDTRKAGSVLANFEDYPFVGTAIEISGPSDSMEISLLI